MYIIIERIRPDIYLFSTLSISHTKDVLRPYEKDGCPWAVEFGGRYRNHTFIQNTAATGFEEWPTGCTTTQMLGRDFMETPPFFL
jgi:hypothetical protein